MLCPKLVCIVKSFSETLCEEHFYKNEAVQLIFILVFEQSFSHLKTSSMVKMSIERLYKCIHISDRGIEDTQHLLRDLGRSDDSGTIWMQKHELYKRSG